jgi:hypothetical protein
MRIRCTAEHGSNPDLPARSSPMPSGFLSGSSAAASCLPRSIPCGLRSGGKCSTALVLGNAVQAGAGLGEVRPCSGLGIEDTPVAVAFRWTLSGRTALPNRCSNARKRRRCSSVMPPAWEPHVGGDPARPYRVPTITVAVESIRTIPSRMDRRATSRVSVRMRSRVAASVFASPATTGAAISVMNSQY